MQRKAARKTPSDANAGPPNETRSGQAPTVYSVTELTRQIQSVLEEAMPPFWLVGEISNLRQPRSGHIYLTLKDANAQIGAVVWRSLAAKLRFRIEDGQEVLVFGRLDVYPPHGTYQVIVERIEPKGIGALQLAFQQLQEKLNKEGLFDPAHKKPIPFLPSRIGIVTSETGAAIQDILTVLTRRFPGVNAALYPVRVQGEGAAEEIARAIRRMNEIGGFDVLIVGRGGGSIEDLWAFNEEVVARAIYASQIPVISAVGHETDLTIADLVADRRALTPTEAAEIAVPVREDLLENLHHLRQRLRAGLVGRVDEARLRLKSCAESYALRQPVTLVQQKQQRVDELTERLTMAIHRQIEKARERHARLAEVLETLSPLKVLGRGYSITLRLDDGQVVRNVSQVQRGDALRTILGAGEIISKVDSVKEGPAQRDSPREGPAAAEP